MESYGRVRVIAQEYLPCLFDNFSRHKHKVQISRYIYITKGLNNAIKLINFLKLCVWFTGFLVLNVKLN